MRPGEVSQSHRATNRVPRLQCVRRPSPPSQAGFREDPLELIGYERLREGGEAPTSEATQVYDAASYFDEEFGLETSLPFDESPVNFLTHQFDAALGVGIGSAEDLSTIVGLLRAFLNARPNLVQSVRKYIKTVGRPGTEIH